MPETTVRLAVFDLDNTLLAGDSDYLWGRFLVDQGLVDAEHYERENRRFYAAYVAGTLDIHAFAEFSLKPLTQHPPSTLHQWREAFVRTVIKPIIAPRAGGLLTQHRMRGDTILITTATNAFITGPIAELLGVENLIATQPEMIDGRYTGRLSGTPNFQDGKVANLSAWLERHPPVSHISCYSDSHNDLPLLEMADAPVAVDPDEKLKQLAERRQWPVISLR